MSDSARLDLEQLAVANETCRRCKATPGDPCVTRSGRRASYSHAARTTSVYAAWRAGYGEGWNDAMESSISNSPYWQRRVAEHIASKKGS